MPLLSRSFGTRTSIFENEPATASRGWRVTCAEAAAGTASVAAATAARAIFFMVGSHLSLKFQDLFMTWPSVCSTLIEAV